MIDTKEIRGHFDVWTKNVVTEYVAELCDEVDRLRDQLKEGPIARWAYGEVSRLKEETNKLTAEVSRLRERLGEKVCSKCGAHALVLHHVTVEVDETAHGGERNGPYDRICRKCIDNAVAALRKP